MNPVQPSYAPLVEYVAREQAMHSAPGVISNANDLISRIASIFNVAIYLLVGLAVLFIVFNIIWYMIRPNEPNKMDSLKSAGWGVVGLAIIVSLWGLVNVLVSTFRTNTNGLPNLPNADFVNQRGTTNNDFGNELSK